MNPVMRGGFFMSTLDATISMLEAMPEDARIKVLSDLAESRQQTAAGQGINMEDALNKMGKQHRFTFVTN